MISETNDWPIIFPDNSFKINVLVHKMSQARLPVFSKEDIINMKNAFDAFDDDRDNLVQTDVLDKLLRSIGFNPFPEEIEDIIEDIDSDEIDFNGFLYVVYKHGREVDPAKELINSFRVFDKDGSGTLPVEKIREILSNLKNPYTEDQIDELIDIADPEDETIDYKSFVDVILSY